MNADRHDDGFCSGYNAPASTTPDLLNNLHSLRSLANAVKQQCDDMNQWQIAAIVATISEEASLCIDKFNSVKR